MNNTFKFVWLVGREFENNLLRIVMTNNPTIRTVIERGLSK